MTFPIPSGKRLHNYGKSLFLMGKLTMSMAIFNSYFDITRGYQPQRSDWPPALPSQTVPFKLPVSHRPGNLPEVSGSHHRPGHLNRPATSATTTTKHVGLSGWK